MKRRIKKTQPRLPNSVVIVTALFGILAITAVLMFVISAGFSVANPVAARITPPYLATYVSQTRSAELQIVQTPTPTPPKTKTPEELAKISLQNFWERKGKALVLITDKKTSVQDADTGQWMTSGLYDVATWPPGTFRVGDALSSSAPVTVTLAPGQYLIASDGLVLEQGDVAKIQLSPKNVVKLSQVPLLDDDPVLVLAGGPVPFDNMEMLAITYRVGDEETLLLKVRRDDDKSFWLVPLNGDFSFWVWESLCGTRYTRAFDKWDAGQKFAVRMQTDRSSIVFWKMPEPTPSDEEKVER